MDTSPLFEKKTRVIDGTEYTVVLFPAGRGFELLFDLKTIAGDSIGSLFGGNVESAITKIGGGMGKSEILEFVLRLLEFTFPPGQTQGFNRQRFDAHFAGRYGHLLKVLGFVIEVNFTDFFDELRTGLVDLTGKFDKMMEQAGATVTAAAGLSSLKPPA
jgi:hypothetical protein